LLNVLQRPELLSTLLEGRSDGLSIIDAHGVQVYVNDALCSMLGFTRDELIGKAAPHPYWPADQVQAIEAAPG
jgi:PAS domain S-box-containing protein